MNGSSVAAFAVLAMTRTDDGFLPEYVNVFGVPLSIYEPGEGGGRAPPPPKPSTQIDVVPDRASLELRWPNVLRIETVVKPELVVDWATVEVLTLDPVATVISAEIAPHLAARRT